MLRIDMISVLKYRLNLYSIDYVILVMLIIGGVYGFSKFPAFISFADAIKVTHPVIIVLFFGVFDIVLVFKITNRAFFSFLAALLASFAIGIVLAVIAFLALVILVQRSTLDTW